MKAKLMRYDRETGTNYFMATFAAKGDALWAATIFEAHKSISRRFGHYVQFGKEIHYPSGALDPEMFLLAKPAR